MKSIKPILTFAKIDIKRLFRDKVGIFFVFAFPLVFLLVFGGLFGRDQEVSFKVAVFNESESQFSQGFIDNLKESAIFKVSDDVKTKEEANEMLSRSSLDAYIILPANFGETSSETALPSGQAQVLYNRGNDQTGATLGSVLEKIFGEINSSLVPKEEPFSLALEPIGEQGLSSMDYIFAGMLGFTILSLGIFGPTTVFPRMKVKGVLRRYHSTPIKVWQYFAANVLSNSIVGIMAIAIMFGAALAVFDINMRGDYLSLLAMVIIGTIALFGIGLAIGGWAKNENQAAPLANLVTFPMMFLSGVFFPRFLMPEWLQSISYYLPLTPLVDGFRMIITEGRSIFELGAEVGLLALWIAVVYSLAFWLFRWE